MGFNPHVTVAAVIEKDGKYLFVEEVSAGRTVINQPAGHLEANETLAQATIRETLEETGHHIELTDYLGIYLYTAPSNGVTYVRHGFCAKVLSYDASATLDDGIIGPLWLTYDEFLAQSDRHRAPLVKVCLDDYRAGKHYPLDIIYHHQES